jgi:hypothetical protein
MNCKPGDLAVIVKLFQDDEPSFLGKLLRVTRLRSKGSDLGYEGQAWEYEGPRLVHKRMGAYLAIADECLRPIRDPGEDARDETLNWLPVPQKEIA